MINSINRVLGKVIIFLSSTMFGVMVLVAVWQVVSRYLLNSPSTFSEEFLRYSLIWVTMIGGAYAFHIKKHIAIDMFVERFSTVIQNRIRQCALIFLVLFSLIVMVYGGIQIVLLTTTQQTVSLGIPMGYVYLSLPVSGVLITWFTVVELVTGSNGAINESIEEDLSIH
ncbi:TRAP transporter small permease [Alkalicoccobacillus gibsonii]|uniref:TRAP transporter small permease n=1 Tax=Alkalicoccobacillus gibsonii TaxID=79881 RepID=A0ABU9VMF8_9BACI